MEHSESSINVRKKIDSVKRKEVWSGTICRQFFSENLEGAGLSKMNLGAQDEMTAFTGC